jgi:uncharacterized phage-associated protein
MTQNSIYPVSDALTVADDILRAAKKLGRALTPMQLMKLTYISHGWHLAILETDLFSDSIEAWKYGPVIPVLYRATKKFGRSHIPLDQISDSEMRLVDQSRALVADVVSKYSHLSGIALSDLTHASGTPWSQVYREGVMNLVISDSVIKDHYKRLLRDRST